jgi:ADP-heptose:LPS heptosyltransferase
MSKNKGVGIARFGGLGDNLIATSVFPALKAKYGYLEVLTKEPQGVVFENNPHVDRIVYKEDGDFPQTGADDWQQWFVTRGKEYEAFFHLSHTCEFEAALFPGDSRFWRSSTFRRKRCNLNYLELVHDACDLPYSPIGTSFFPTHEERTRAQVDRVEKLLQRRPGPLIGWVCSGSRIDKRHPRAGYAVARMIRELGATVALFGGHGSDRLIAQEIETQVRQHNGNLDRLATCLSLSSDQDIWPVRRGLAQVQACDLLITPDTGPQWAVSALDMPKIVLLSHASPENITKYAINTTSLIADVNRVACWPCHRLHANFTTCTPNFENDGPACMSDVSVEAIVQAAGLWLTDEERAKASIAKPLTTEGLLAAICAPPEAPHTEGQILSFAAVG